MIDHASARAALRQIFAGWSHVDCWRDATNGRWTIKASLDDRDIAYAALHGADRLAERIAPKTGIKPMRCTGVRFKGRIVGRRV